MEVEINLEDFEIGECEKCKKHRVTKKGYCLDCYETNNNDGGYEHAYTKRDYITEIKDAIDKE